MQQQRKIIEDMEQISINSANKENTQRNKEMHTNRYLEFCDLNCMRAFPVTEFKICKFASFLGGLMKTVQSGKAYCYTICKENEL